jgi:hypothetical protein
MRCQQFRQDVEGVHLAVDRASSGQANHLSVAGNTVLIWKRAGFNPLQCAMFGGDGTTTSALEIRTLKRRERRAPNHTLKAVAMAESFTRSGNIS